MEIRECDTKMEDNESPSIPIKHFSRPPSPCDSEISVGCEDDPPVCSSEASPMEVNSAGASSEDEDEGPITPSTVRGGEVSSPSLSPRGESLTYLSDDDYFRPLKRLAMCSPSPPPTSVAKVIQSHTSPNQQMSPESSETDRSPIHSPQPSPQIEIENSNKTIEEEVVVAGQRVVVNNNNNNNNNELLAKQAGLRSFTILDILSYKPSKRKSSVPVKIERPWESRGAQKSGHENATKKNNDKGGALDALFKMTNKTLDDLNKDEKAENPNLFNNRSPPKKKRKSRTAFTNHQIFELEKRFLYQKYLSPADRDELAQTLGLSNAQVITWFQNRRAKLKRDMEELKRDVESSKVMHTSKSLLEASVNVAAFLKAKDLPKIPIATMSHP